MENEKTIENDFDKAVEFIVKSESNKNLNKCLDVVKELEERDKENKRLNNIINELEKDLQSNMAYYDNLYEKLDEQEYIDKYFALKEVFNKLQELKGSDSNE